MLSGAGLDGGVLGTTPGTVNRPAAGSLKPGTCRLVSYRGRELEMRTPHDHHLSVYRQATAPKLGGDASAVPPALHPLP